MVHLLLLTGSGGSKAASIASSKTFLSPFYKTYKNINIKIHNSHKAKFINSIFFFQCLTYKCVLGNFTKKTIIVAYVMSLKLF